MKKLIVYILVGLFHIFGNRSFAQEPSKSCSVVFPSPQASEKGQHHSQTSEKISHHLESSPQFQEAANSYFQATIGQASQSMTTQEKMSLFSKLTQFAQEQKLSKADFTAMIEAEKDKFVRTQVLGIQPGAQIIELNQHNSQQLESSKYLLKLSTMSDFYSPNTFATELDKIQYVTIQSERQSGSITRNTLADSKFDQELMESFRGLNDYDYLLKKLKNPSEKNSISYDIYPNDQNPHLRQIVFYFLLVNNQLPNLWVLQEKVETLKPTEPQENLWKTIAEQQVEFSPRNIYENIFVFYSPDLNKIVLAPLFECIKDFQWFVMDSQVTPEIISKLPHIRQNQQSSIGQKITKYFRSDLSILLGHAYSDESNSFYFVHFYLPEKLGNSIGLKVTHISPKDDQDYQFTNQLLVEASDIKSYATHFSFAKDGSFIKIIHYASKEKIPYNTTFSPIHFFSNNKNYHLYQPAPPPAEDGQFRQTKYFFPINSLQVKSSKSRSE